MVRLHRLYKARFKAYVMERLEQEGSAPVGDLLAAGTEVTDAVKQTLNGYLQGMTSSKGRVELYRSPDGEKRVRLKPEEGQQC